MAKQPLLVTGDVKENLEPGGDESYHFTAKNILWQLSTVVEWKPLGIELGIGLTKLSEIEKNYHGIVQDCRLSMVEFWITSDTSASWNKLACALDKVSQNVKAQEVRELGRKEAGSSGAAIGEISSSRRQSGGGREGDNFKADVSEHPLGEDDLMDVFTEVLSIAEKWKPLGFALGLKSADLDDISVKNNADPTECLRNMLLAWLQQKYNSDRFGPPSWKVLCQAIYNPAGCNDPGLAREIAVAVPSVPVSKADEDFKINFNVSLEGPLFNASQLLRRQSLGQYQLPPIPLRCSVSYEKIGSLLHSSKLSLQCETSLYPLPANQKYRSLQSLMQHQPAEIPITGLMHKSHSTTLPYNAQKLKLLAASQAGSLFNASQLGQIRRSQSFGKQQYPPVPLRYSVPDAEMAVLLHRRGSSLSLTLQCSEEQFPKTQFANRKCSSLQSLRQHQTSSNYSRRQPISEVPIYKTTIMRDLIHTVASKISSKWRAVGKVLKLPTGTLDRIQKCNALKPNKDIASFEHMLYIWMQQDLLYKVQPFSPFTWQSIIEALREPSVGEVDLAEKLTKKHIHANWNQTRKPVDTRGVVVGKYELRKFAREEEEKRKATEAKAIYESSVICDVPETRTTEYHRSSVPVIKSIENVRNKWDGTLAGLLGVKKRVYYTEQVHVGNTVTKHMREEQRTIKTLGSGQVIYEDWKTVREWTDVHNEPR